MSASPSCQYLLVKSLNERDKKVSRIILYFHFNKSRLFRIDILDFFWGFMMEKYKISIWRAIHFILRKVIMQGKLFQRCTHHLYSSVLLLGGNVNTRRMSKLDMGSIFQIKNQWNILVIGNFYVNYQNLILLTSSDTKRTLMHLFLFTNSAQRELVSICTQGIRNCN